MPFAKQSDIVAENIAPGNQQTFTGRSQLSRNGTISRLQRDTVASVNDSLDRPIGTQPLESHSMVLAHFSSGLNAIATFQLKGRPRILVRESRMSAAWSEASY